MLAFIIFFAKIQYLLEVCQGKRSHSIFHANLECIIHILILSLTPCIYYSKHTFARQGQLFTFCLLQR